MNKLLTGIITVLIIIGMTSIASAGLVDAASNAISDGIEEFLISISDDIFGMSFSGYDNTAGYGTVGYIYNIASYTPDPFKSEITQDFIVYSKSIFLSCYPILLLCAFLYPHKKSIRWDYRSCFYVYFYIFHIQNQRYTHENSDDFHY